MVGEGHGFSPEGNSVLLNPLKSFLASQYIGLAFPHEKIKGGSIGSQADVDARARPSVRAPEQYAFRGLSPTSVTSRHLGYSRQEIQSPDSDRRKVRDRQICATEIVLLLFVK